MKKSIRLSFVWCFLLLVGQVSAANWVTEIRSNSQEKKLQIVMDVTDKPRFKAFSLTQPQRLVVDLQARPSTDYANNLSFKNRGVRVVRTNMRGGDQVRVVLDLLHDFRWRVYALPPEGNRGYRVVIDVFDYARSNRGESAAIIASAKSQSSVPLPVEKAPEIISPITMQSITEVAPSVTPVLPSVSKTVTTVSKKAVPLPKTVAPAPKKTPPVEPVAKVKPMRPTAVQKKKSETPSQKPLLVMIDPGHGGKDSGAIGKRKTLEKNVVLSIAKRLKKHIDAMPNMRAILTRNDDRYISLRGRLRLAQKHKPDLFVSIHADAFTKSSVRGSSVFILSNRGASSEAARWLASRANAVDLKYGVDIGDYDEDVSNVLIKMQQDATIESSHALASKTLGRLKGIGKVHKRYVERAGFAVLKSPDIPSMLVETAFISNPEEERKLKTSHYQEKLARAIASGIRQFFESRASHQMMLEKGRGIN